MSARRRAITIMVLSIVQIAASGAGVWAGYRLHQLESTLPVPDRLPVSIGAFLIIGSCLMLGLSLVQCAVAYRQLRRLRTAPAAREAATISPR